MKSDLCRGSEGRDYFSLKENWGNSEQMGTLTRDYILVQPQISKRRSEVKWGKFQHSLVIS